MSASLVGSEMCIRDRAWEDSLDRASSSTGRTRWGLHLGDHGQPRVAVCAGSAEAGIGEGGRGCRAPGQ
eukprot:9443428-Alexandrium_andersonii.AAC.1